MNRVAIIGGGPGFMRESNLIDWRGREAECASRSESDHCNARY